MSNKSGIIGRLKLAICCVLGAASVAKASECEGILGYIKDQTSFSGSSTSYNAYYRVLCTKEEESYESSRSSQISAGLIFEELPVELEGSSRDNQWSMYKKTLCEQIKTGNFSSSQLQVTISKANEQAIDAWTKCINSAGLHFYIAKSNWETSFFTISAKFIPLGASNGTTAAEPIVFTPAGAVKCDGRAIKKGTRIFAGGISNNCARDNTKPLLITLNTKDGTKTIFLPAVMKNSAIAACEIPKMKTYKETSAPAGFPRIEVNVEQGYKIIGGGANDEWSGEGNYLTGAYPETLQKWVATGKAHLRLAEGKITAWAIAIYDPKNQWDVRIFSNTGDAGSHSQATATVDSGYIMLGGGAKSNWTGLGSMLTGSFPADSQSWTAESHDHLEVSRSNTTSYAIGIKPINCKWSGDVKIFSGTSGIAMLQKASAIVGQNYQIASIGARTVSNNPGTLLTGIVLENNGATALAKGL